MSYNLEFYNLYEKYLLETSVVNSHTEAIHYFSNLNRGPDVSNVLDLGCGLGEYGTFGFYTHYVGIDKQEELKNHDRWKVTPPNQSFMCSDYSNLEFKDKLRFRPTIFVSLFSIEACFNVKEKYSLYDRLFEAFPLIDHAMVSGFYYASKSDQEMIVENCGIESYQTIEPIEAVQSSIFKESRMIMHTPSKMFGPDVFEVWKFLVRK